MNHYTSTSTLPFIFCINYLKTKFDMENKTSTNHEKTLCTIPRTGSSVFDVVHWFNIKVIGEHREVIEYLSWSGLVWELRLKYDWYFKYRAALLQVKYPKFEIQTTWGNEPAGGRTLEKIRKDKIRGKKATITKHKNSLRKAKENWVSLFPIEDDPDYQRAIEKISRLEFELQALLTLLPTTP